MGRLRLAAGAAVLVVALTVPASALAQINSFEVSTRAILGPGGLALPVKISCEQGDFVMVDLTLTQSRGGGSAQGFAFDEVTCSGSVQALLFPFRTLPMATPFVPGKAVVTGCLALFDDEGAPILGDVVGPRTVHVRERVSRFKFVSELSGRTGCFE